VRTRHFNKKSEVQCNGSKAKEEAPSPQEGQAPKAPIKSRNIFHCLVSGAVQFFSSFNNLPTDDDGNRTLTSFGKNYKRLRASFAHDFTA
jgi:hypothetical protein